MINDNTCYLDVDAVKDCENCVACSCPSRYDDADENAGDILEKTKP